MNNNIEDDDFVLVQPKKRYQKNVNQQSNIVLQKEQVIEEVKNILENSKPKPYAAYLYGSTARGQNKNTSDIDIFVIWKNKIPNDDIINNVHNQLYIAFNRKIDFVNYLYNGKFIKIDLNNSCFVQNILPDAITIIEGKDFTIKDILFKFDCYFKDF